MGTTCKIKIVSSSLVRCLLVAVTTVGGTTAPGDTLHGGDTRMKNNFVAEFTKNSGQMRSDR